MNLINILIFVAIVHFLLFFFNTIFVTCMHYPYISMLKKTGIKVHFLRIKLFTTAFNRVFMKWGVSKSKFWSVWFNAGIFASIGLLLVSLYIVVKMSLRMIWDNSDSGDGSGDMALELVIPGLDVPLRDFGFCVLSFFLCNVVHELGHAMAAVREDVRFCGIGVMILFIVIAAFCEISDEQLTLLPPKNQLRILSAGVWHNIVLACFSIFMLGVVSLLFSPFFKTNTGVFVDEILMNSPMRGPGGLARGDVIYKINECVVLNSTGWKSCILQAANQRSPGYCVTEKMIRKLDKSDKSSENCCEHYNAEKGYTCFEYLETFDNQPPQTTQFCLPTRAIVESSHNFCQSNDLCPLLNDVCIKPIVSNTTKVTQIQRYSRKDVIYIGNPMDVFQTTILSDWVPKFSFLSPYYPELLALMFKYIAIFSLGMAIINVLPCLRFDGCFITNTLVEISLRNKVTNQNLRSLIALMINCTFTFLLGVNLLNLCLKKFYN